MARGRAQQKLIAAREAAIAEQVNAEARDLWRSLGCPKPPPRPAFCASCIYLTPNLEVRISCKGRPVWLCASCRSLIGTLRQMQTEEE